MIAMALTLVGFVVAAFRSTEQRRILWLCLAAFAGVCLQGAFGGYTVRHQLPVWTSTVHGMLAEVFFTIVLAIVMLSRTRVAHQQQAPHSHALQRVVVGTWLLIGIQFLLGALTRHSESWGVSSSWPMWDSTSFLPSAELWQYPQVAIHFIHRTMAYVVGAVILLQWWQARQTSFGRLALMQVVLVVIQVALGAGIIFTAREEVTTTAHVMVGVVLLASSAWMGLRIVFNSPTSDAAHASALAGVRS